ncbi:MAG: hypothetical protein QOJ07_1242 [Thermoleophilaceae bacterium]|nr:hypothetical protein [Thermoleophilaceae bacterium]
MIPRHAARRAAAAALACTAAAALPACNVSKIGGDDSGTASGKAAKAAVIKFAEATGPSACDLLTPNALRNVYGGPQANGKPAAPLAGPPPQYALDNCRKAAPKFQGDTVTIDKVNNIAQRAVKVQASVDNGQRMFDVTVRRKNNTWLIDEIREK